MRTSGPIPDANGAAKPDGKRKRPNKNVSVLLLSPEYHDANRNEVDMEKLADGLQKLDEESLLHVVQLVHDHKSAETYAKNDVESMCTCLIALLNL